jgi:prepilin-type N-terminal cleavage/methylation domain-containing protein
MPCDQGIYSSSGITKGKRDVKQPKGFSLVELLIAMAIIGIISTIAAFAWQRYVTNANLRTAARDVASDILLFKERAVSESIQYRLTFNVAANRYTIDRGTAAGAPFFIIQSKSPATFGSGVSLLDTTFVGGQVSFLPRGTLGSGTGRVRLTNSRHSTATVTVTITGKTSVQFAMQ